MSSITGMAPDFIEPIVAYRSWRYRVRDGAATLMPLRTHGANGRNDWEGSPRGWVTASCPVPSSMHAAPDESCNCGFYALKLEDAASMQSFQWPPRAAPFEPDGVVFGRVELAGKVIEHDLGYRAQRARVAELIPMSSDGGLARWVAGLLDLPVGAELDTAGVYEEVAAVLASSPVMPTSAMRIIVNVLLKMHVQPHEIRELLTPPN